MYIIFLQLNGYIEDLDRSKYLALRKNGKYEKTFDKIKHLIMLNNQARSIMLLIIHFFKGLLSGVGQFLTI